MGPCNWEIIRKIKQSLSIPVIANGGIATYEDCIKCLEYTGCDGVMSSESILEYPALFDNSKIFDLDHLSWEYLEMVERYPGEADMKNVRSHLHKFLYTGLQIHTDLRDRLSDAKSLDVLKEVDFFRFSFKEIEYDFDNQQSFCETIQRILKREVKSNLVIEFSSSPHEQLEMF